MRAREHLERRQSAAAAEDAQAHAWNANRADGRLRSSSRGHAWKGHTSTCGHAWKGHASASHAWPDPASTAELGLELLIYLRGRKVERVHQPHEFLVIEP